MYQCLGLWNSIVCLKRTLFLAADDLALHRLLPDGKDVRITVGKSSVRSKPTKYDNSGDQKTRGVPPHEPCKSAGGSRVRGRHGRWMLLRPSLAFPRKLLWWMRSSALWERARPNPSKEIKRGRGPQALSANTEGTRSRAVRSRRGSVLVLVRDRGVVWLLYHWVVRGRRGSTLEQRLSVAGDREW